MHDLGWMQWWFHCSILWLSHCRWRVMGIDNSYSSSLDCDGLLPLRITLFIHLQWKWIDRSWIERSGELSRSWVGVSSQQACVSQSEYWKVKWMHRISNHRTVWYPTMAWFNWLILVYPNNWTILGQEERVKREPIGTIHQRCMERRVLDWRVIYGRWALRWLNWQNEETHIRTTHHHVMWWITFWIMSRLHSLHRDGHVTLSTSSASVWWRMRMLDGMQEIWWMCVLHWRLMNSIRSWKTPYKDSLIRVAQIYCTVWWLAWENHLLLVPQIVPLSTLNWAQRAMRYQA